MHTITEYKLLIFNLTTFESSSLETCKISDDGKTKIITFQRILHHIQSDKLMWYSKAMSLLLCPTITTIEGGD